MIYIYDIEAYKYLFCIVFYDIKNNEHFIFEISNRKNQLKELISFCSNIINNNGSLIGFNNLNYDYPILHKILLNELPTCLNIYEYSNHIINSDYTELPVNQLLIPQLDLYRLNHFDNKNKRTSLKALEIAMKSDDIIDLPYSITEPLHSYQMDEIIHYCKHDVDETYKFYLKNIPLIELRATLSDNYNLYLYNDNDPKMGSEIFLDILSKELKISKYELRKMRTYRSKIDLNECILDKISFNSEPLVMLLQWLKSQVITETKNVFSEIDLNKVMSLLPYCDKTLKNGKLETLNIIYNNLQYNIGLGGIHACIEPGIYEANDEYIIEDIDVTSFYPNLAITNNFYPEHLSSKFCDIYKSIFEQRILIPKSDPRNYAYKILLNGLYGKSNDQYSYVYDPKFTMSITCNGQLFILKLVENLTNALSFIKVLQANTDGISVMIKKSEYDILLKICKEWEEFTNLNLEYAHYSKMIIRDVNSYYAVYTDSKKPIKVKGFFEIEKAWHKNHSMLIVMKALYNYFINNIPVEYTIAESTDIFDFCKRARSDSNSYLISRYYDNNGNKIDNKLQKNNRYYISNSGIDIIKVLKPLEGKDKLTKYRQENPLQLDLFHFVEDVKIEKERETFIEANYKCKLFNKYYKAHYFNDYDINYDYYINECYKIINIIENKNE